MKDIKNIRFEFSEPPSQINLIKTNNSARKEIHAKLHFSLQKPTILARIIVKFQGECLITMTDSTATTAYVRNMFTFVKCHLVNIQESILSSPQDFGTGDHSIPFTISVRQDLPSSQEHKLADKIISITYRAGAVLEPPLNPISKLVRSAGNAKASADSYEVVALTQYTTKSTTDLFPIKQVNYHGKREAKIEYSFKVPEAILVPLQRVHMRGSLLPSEPDSIVSTIVVELCQQKLLSLVSKDPLRPSTYPMQECNADLDTKVLGDRRFRYEQKQGAEQIDLDFDIYFKSDDVIATFTSPMLDIDYFVRARIVFASDQKDMVLKFPTQMATVQDMFELPVSPPLTDQVLPQYSADESAPSYDALSSSL